MAVYFAVKNGNVNATDVWATTPTGIAGNFFPSFTNQDILMSNGFTVTINVTTTVKEIRTDNAYGATDNASTRFNINGGVTLTADIYANSQNACLDTSAGAVSPITIVGSVYGGTGGSGWAALQIIGTSTTVNFTGNVFGGRTSQAVGIGIHPNSGSTLNVVGNVYGGRGGNAFGLSLTGNGSARANVTGNIFGGLNAAGVSVGGIVILTIIGTSTGNLGAGVTVGAVAATVTISRVKGGPWLNSAVGIANGSTTASVTITEAEYGDLGASPTSGSIRFNNTVSSAILMYLGTSNKKSLVDINNSSILPSTSNVRAGIVFNDGNSTGTCSIPTSSNVLFGVPCDSGTGTGSLTPAILWNYLVSNATASGSMGERLSTCSTIASTSQQIANIIGN